MQMPTAAVMAVGRSIVLCLYPATIVVSSYEIAARATLREHKHPFVRYADVLTGTLRVSDTKTATSVRPDILSSKRLDSGIKLLTSMIGR
jgi:quercetin dioxygenase-like cupin family protein